MLALSHQLQTQTKCRRILSVAMYAGSAAALTIWVYAMAFVVHSGSPFQMRQFFQWIISYSQDAAFSFAIGRNLVKSLTGNIQLFLGGRLSLVRELWNP